MRNVPHLIPIRFWQGLFCGLLAFLAVPNSSRAASWWNEEWTLRRKITVDTTEAGGGVKDSVGPVAVLIRLHDGTFNFGNAKEDGSDIRFVAEDDKTLLPFHIEKYDGLLNEAFAWVKIPEIKGAAKTSFWLYYGNGGPKATKVEDIKATYDPDSVLIYHFSEKGAPPVDVTSSANNGQNAGVPIEGSMIGGGVRLTGKTPITIPTSPSLEWTDGSALTWAAWIKAPLLQPKAEILERRDGNKSFIIGLDNGVPYVEVNGQRSSAGAAMAVNAWHHLAVVATGGKISVYLDGDSYGSLAAGIPALNSVLMLGGDTANGATGFAGEIDEMQISKVARSESFIKFASTDQAGGDKTAKMITVGEDEQMATWFSWINTGYFGIIIKSLTPDGWAVICILALMACVSWFVMLSKNSYLNGIGKGNKRFMKEWEHLAMDLTALDCDDPDKVKTLGGRVDKSGLRVMKKSPIYHIYHTGIAAIRHRLSGTAATAPTDDSMKALSSRSMQAIRATMDGALVREQQKLSSLIVFLTLSISGGPFLGLLGTVVGVMITFAAVAQAGDVNVNAIAPGIAAALLATVAGLAVAIPALFGYNYLLARIKDATSDMHVFIDEFVTRIAEVYRE